MLVVDYNPLLVLGAVAVAVMSAFTGLTLAGGIARLAPAPRKARIAMAAVALGGGIWSTHFVAMLALRLPVPVFYDALTTLASALVAILLVGAALLLLHFAPPSRLRLPAAGALMGAGIVAMHYIGMAGIEGCGTAFRPEGVVVSSLLALALSIAALHLAGGRRGLGHLVPGAAAYGGGIVAMHFSAMAWTGFLPAGAPGVTAPAISNDHLALIVALATFAICGAFLLTTATARESEAAAAPEAPPEATDAPPVGGGAARLPYELEGRTYFVPAAEVMAVRAEGHYTTLFRGNAALFCPWPISRVEEEVRSARFHRTHRSYLVNLDCVRGFERRKDQGACFFDIGAALREAPVSRTNLAETRQLLGL